MEKIVKQIIETLKTFKEVEAIALGGAHARGVADKYSDVDIYVFFNRKLTDENLRKKKLLRLAPFDKTFIGGLIDFFEYMGKDIHTWWADINKLKKDLRNHDDIYARVLVTEPRLLWDRKGKFREIRKTVKFPAWLTEKICVGDLTLRSTSVIFREIVEKSVHRNRLYFAEWYIKTQTDNIIKAIYALNRRYYYILNTLNLTSRSSSVSRGTHLEILTE